MSDKSAPTSREEALRQADADLDALRRKRKPSWTGRIFKEWFADDGPADILLALARALFARAVAALAITLVAILLISESCAG